MVFFGRSGVKLVKGSIHPITGNQSAENRAMEKTDNMPIWVYLAFSSIATRKGASLLIWACVLFCIYCIPWVLLFPGRDWVAQIFLIEDWSWFAMMIPISFWYWLSLRWMDNNSGWAATQQHDG
jgi:hypothetical protein